MKEHMRNLCEPFARQKRSTQNDEHAREVKGKKFESNQARGTTKNFIFSTARTNKSKK